MVTLVAEDARTFERADLAAVLVQPLRKKRRCLWHLYNATASAPGGPPVLLFLSLRYGISHTTSPLSPRPRLPHPLRLCDASVAPLCLSPTQQIEKHARVEAGAEGILRAVARRTHALRTIERLALHFLLDHLALKLISIMQPLALFFNLCRLLRHGTCA